MESEPKGRGEVESRLIRTGSAIVWSVVLGGVIGGEVKRDVSVSLWNRSLKVGMVKIRRRRGSARSAGGAFR